MTNEKHISTITMHIVTKPIKAVTYHKKVPSIDLSMCQFVNYISTLEDPSTPCLNPHNALITRPTWSQVTIGKFYISAVTRFMATKTGRVLTIERRFSTKTFKFSPTSCHYAKRVRIRSYSGPHFSRIVPHLDRIRRDTEYFSVLSPNAGKFRKNVDQNNSEYERLLRRVFFLD